MSSGKQQTYSKGLVGVIAGTTSTCDVGPGGHGLFYRGAHSRQACISSRCNHKLQPFYGCILRDTHIFPTAPVFIS
jgi:hypothetical protein